LLSWICSEEDKQLWSGNTFQNGLNADIFSIHMQRKEVYSHCYLGEKNSLIAYGEIVFTDGEKGILCRVIVNPDLRKLGIGKKFIRELSNWAFKKKSLQKIILNTFGHNHPARKCYQSLGFKEVSFKKNFRKVKNKWRDLVVMEKNVQTIENLQTQQ
jgi:RimJ/RimL family protein N-acetyltransferase